MDSDFDFHEIIIFYLVGISFGQYHPGRIQPTAQCTGVKLALDAAFLHQPADPEGAARRRLVRRDLRWRIEEDQVALEGVQHERRNGAHRYEQAAGDGA